jgi:hypothetical protein
LVLSKGANVSGTLYIGKVGEKKQPCESVFRLAGKNEDALTYALGYLLAKDPPFCSAFLRECGVTKGRRGKQWSNLFDDHQYEIHLQEVTDREVGRRDIVIEAGSKIRAVIEAKIGSALPNEKQILKYAKDQADWKSVDPKSGCLAIVAVTRDQLPRGTNNAAQKELKKGGITLYEFRWCQVYSLVQKHRHKCKSTATQWMFDEFLRFFRRDYEMKHYDAEVTIQDVDNVNAEIFDKGWMYVTDQRGKAEPLYFAPYLTKTRRKGTRYESRYNGILYVGRVRRVEDLTVEDLLKSNLTSILKPGDYRQDRWADGLDLIKKRAKEEKWKTTNTCRLYFLDSPFKLRRTPLIKTGKRRFIPSMIPPAFSLSFEQLLK